MKATMKQNQNGTYQYIFEDGDDYVKIVKKASKCVYKYMLIGHCNASKGAEKDGEGWFFIAMGNNPKNVINSWKNMWTHCDLKIINIEQA